MNKQITRGCIYLYDFGQTEGSNQEGFRPVLVIENNGVIKNATEILVVPITSVIKNPYWYPHIYLGRKFGLDAPSMALFEQITRVNKEKLKCYIGTVNDHSLLKLIDRTIMKVFGVHIPESEHTNDIRCLCKKHCDDYRLTGSYILRRFDPYQNVKDKCDKCNDFGYDYLLIDKKDAYRKRSENYGKTK